MSNKKPEESRKLTKLSQTNVKSLKDDDDDDDEDGRQLSVEDQKLYEEEEDENRALLNMKEDDSDDVDEKDLDRALNENDDDDEDKKDDDDDERLRGRRLNEEVKDDDDETKDRRRMNEAEDKAEAQSEASSEKKPEKENEEDDENQDKGRRLKADEQYMNDFLVPHKDIRRNRVLTSIDESSTIVSDETRLLKKGEESLMFFEELEPEFGAINLRAKVMENGYDLAGLNEEEPSPIDMCRVEIDKKLNDEKVGRRLKEMLQEYNYGENLVNAANLLSVMALTIGLFIVIQ